MPMPLERWDKEVAPHLADIRLSAGWLQWYTKKIIMACQSLTTRPAFEAIAYDEMRKTKETLTTALEGIERAMSIYENKPLDS